MIDSHAHLSSLDPFLLPAILKRAQEVGLEAIVNINTTASELERGLRIAQECTTPHIYNAASTHPHDAQEKGEAEFDLIAKQVGALIAIGETGLDYHYNHSSKESQKNLLERYGELAALNDLPLIIHCREAFEDLFAILDRFPSLTVLIHCFTGTLSEAEMIVERGWFISFSGIVTFKKSERLREIVKNIPLTCLLIETDAPFLAPQSKRGKLNEPSYILETAETIAQLRDISLRELSDVTFNNAKRLFKLMKN